MAEHFDSGPRDHNPHRRGGLVRRGDRRFLSVKRWDGEGDQKNENETEKTMDPHAWPPVPHLHYRQRGRKTGMAGVRWPKRIRERSMDAVRWRQVEDIYHLARSRPAEGRAAFLADPCGRHDDLQHRVATLLAADEQAGSFLEVP